ncbi:MAG: ABC transporter permease [Candidatus Riflebacteria bacterium]|nr:ABC transporter permease [Candidatus Riflebacteria bacterium]
MRRRRTLTTVVRRLAEGTALVAALSFGLFWLLARMPGDPLDALLATDPGLTTTDIAQLRKAQGLDDPIPVRYGRWLRRLVVERDPGFSRVHKRPVLEVLQGRTTSTLKLMAGALGLSLALAIPIGALSAIRRHTVFDHGITLMTFAGLSIPAFWLGLVAIITFALWLPLFPAGGSPTPGAGLLEQLRFLALPMLVLAFETTGGWTRYVRASATEALGSDYVRTARAKGLPESTVVLRHGLANALVPLATVVALSGPGLFSGAVVTETVFAWPGMGRLLYDSVLGTDHAVALTSFLTLATLTILFNLLADLAHSWLDPRAQLP